MARKTNSPSDVLGFDDKKARLERAADAAAQDVGNAIRRMGDAIRKYGAESEQARGFEQEADDAFERGERIAAQLLALEAQQGARAPRQVAAAVACG